MKDKDQEFYRNLLCVGDIVHFAMTMSGEDCYCHKFQIVEISSDTIKFDLNFDFDYKIVYNTKMKRYYFDTDIYRMWFS